MTKTDVLDEVIEILIKKAMEDDPLKQNLVQKSKDQISRGEKKDGVYASTCYRKQAWTI